MKFNFKFLIAINFLLFSSTIIVKSQCDLSNFDINITLNPVDTSENLLTVNFDHINTPTGNFILSLGTENTTYSLTDLPINVILQDNIETIPIIIWAENNEDCNYNNSFILPGGYYICNFDTLSTVISNCNENTFDYTIYLLGSNCLSNSYQLEINETYWGQYYVGQTIENLIADCTTSNELKFTNINDDIIQHTIIIDPICCEDLDCQISNFEYFIDSSFSVENMYSLTFDIDYTNPGSTDFEFSINDNTTTYLFSDLPVTIEVPCDGYFYDTIHINSTADENCDIYSLIQTPCLQECNISNLTVIDENCTDQSFDAVINFDYETVGATGFSLTINNMNLGTFEYEDLPITINDLATDCTYDFNIKVTDNQNFNCQQSINIGTICCNDECDLSNINLTTTVIEPDSTSYYLNVDFDYANTPTNNFFMINEGDTTFHSFDDLPLDLLIECDGVSTYNQIILFAENNTACSYFENILNPCAVFCNLDTIDISITDCNNGTFTANLNNINGFCNSDYLVEVNGVNYGSLNSEAINIDGLLADCLTEYEFLIFNVNDPTESVSYNIGSICCEELDCDLSNLELTIGNEVDDNGYYDVIIDFDYTNPGNTDFELNLGQFNENFAFSNLPITIQVPCSANNTDTISIHPVGNEDCSLWEGFYNQCPTTCLISNLNVSTQNCEDGLFDAIIDFDYEDTSPFGFNLTINNQYYGGFDYALLPLTINNINEDCDNSFVFLVYDNENGNDCQQSFELEPICCDPFINDLTYLVSFLDDNTFEVFISFNHVKTECQISVYYNDALQLNIEENSTSNISIGTFNCGLTEDLDISIVSSCQPAIVHEITIPIEETDCTVGILDIHNPNIFTYYNTVNKTLTISNKDDSYSIKNISIYSSFGQSLNYTINQNVIDLEHIADGFIFVKISLDDGTFIVKKVIKY